MYAVQKLIGVWDDVSQKIFRFLIARPRVHIPIFVIFSVGVVFGQWIIMVMFIKNVYEEYLQILLLVSFTITIVFLLPIIVWVMNRLRSYYDDRMM